MGRSKKVVYSYATAEEEAQVSALEDFLFGGAAAASKLLAKPEGGQDIAALVRQAEAAPDDEASDEGDDGFFFVDRAGDAAAAAAAASDDGEGDEEEGEQQQDAAGPGPGSLALQQAEEDEAATGGKGKKRRAPVWVDPADAELSVAVAATARLRKLRQAKGQNSMTGQQYEAALRRQHAALNPRTSWAKAAGTAAAKQEAAQQRSGALLDDSREPDEASAAALLLSGSGLLLNGGAGGGGGLLAPGTIELSRLRDANGDSPCDAVVQALQFHPNGQLLLTAGFDKRLRLFRVDGVRNPLVQSLYLADCPIHSAAFAAGGAKVVAAGRRPFYYVADLHTGQLERVVAPPCLYLQQAAPASKTAPPGSFAAPRSGGGGKAKAGGGMKSCESFVASPDASRPLVAFLGDGGHIGLVSLSSRTPVGALKMNGSARAAAFSADGSTLVTAGGDGVLYTWDLRSQRCLHQQRDEGVLSCSALALSPDGSYLASGDTSGVVNVYSRPAGLLSPLGSGTSAPAPPAQPRPLKSLMNLTTTIDTLSFSHDSQLLVMGSRLKKEALRLAHLPSLSVFSNWPTARSPLHYVHAAALSPHSGFLGVGNAKGRVLLYRLHHYPAA